jgi:carbon-monoxide dehydrogenase medium subunit
VTAVDFAYHRAASIADAVRLLGELAPDALLLAGGGSLGILLNQRAARPAHVIDLNEVGELAGIREERGELWIGAMTRLYDVERSELLADRLPLLPECARTVADPSLRNRITVGGGLAYADASASLPTALLVLDATVHASGPRGGRPLPIDELFVAGHETSLGRDELITHVTVEAPPPSAGTAWLDLDRRRLSYSLVSVAAVARRADGHVRSARVAMAGIAPTPRRLCALESALEGVPAEESSVREAARAATDETDPPSDLHGSAEYRRRMAPEFAARGVLAALGRAAGGG